MAAAANYDDKIFQIIPGKGCFPMWRVRFWRNMQSESGFTLIELLGVAVILIVLALMAIPVYADVTDTAREGRAQDELRTISGALDAFYAEHGDYPVRLSDLVTSGYLKPTGFNTGWTGKKFFYVRTSTNGKKDYVLGVPGDYTNCGPNNAACDPYQVAPGDLIPTGLLHERRGR